MRRCKINHVRTKCINLPYLLLILQIAISIIPIIIVDLSLIIFKHIRGKFPVASGWN